MTSACHISNLHVAFGKTEILHGVSLEAPARGVTMLTGRSGSGKTTLLRALNRLNETFPGCRTSGSVEIDLGRGMGDIYRGKRPVSELRRLVGMVFQTPNVLPVSVYRNIAIPLEAVRGMPKGEIPAAAEKALRSTGLWEEVRDRLDTDASHLSGGPAAAPLSGPGSCPGAGSPSSGRAHIVSGRGGRGGYRGTHSGAREKLSCHRRFPQSGAGREAGRPYFHGKGRQNRKELCPRGDGAGRPGGPSRRQSS